MLVFDKQGWAVSDRIKVERRPNLKHGTMTTVSGIIVHETGAATASSTLNSYADAGAAGAHFLIDKDGSIYQTGSVLWQQWHVGKLQVRCLAEHRCPPQEAKELKGLSYAEINEHEKKKAVPDRYPSNSDSIGIELVGKSLGSGANAPYEVVTSAQNASLSWLVNELRDHFHVPPSEIFRHPVVSYKDADEAASARW